MTVGTGDAEHAALRALLAISQAADRLSPDEVLAMYLEQAIALTRSEIGFFHFVDEDEQTVSLHTWSKGTLAVC